MRQLHTHDGIPWRSGIRQRCSSARAAWCCVGRGVWTLVPSCRAKVMEGERTYWLLFRRAHAQTR